MLLQRSGHGKYATLNPTLTSGNVHASMTQVAALMCSVLMTVPIAELSLPLPPPTHPGYWRHLAIAGTALGTTMYFLTAQLPATSLVLDSVS